MIREKFELILKILRESYEEDLEKIEKGNNSAMRRVLKNCMEATHKLKELRALILEETKK